MRLAILSDIHGNPIALDAVLRDAAERIGVDGYWVLGDLVAQGFDPTTVLDRLTALPNVRFVRGNTDRYTITGDKAAVLSMLGRGLPTPEEIASPVPPELFPAFVTVAQGIAWTRGFLADSGWLDWLAELPLQQRLTLPDGSRMLGVHASPGRDDGPGLEPEHTDEELMARFSGCDAEVVFVGHTHWSQERRSGGVHVVNVGSVSNPRTNLSSDLRASYSTIEDDAAGYEVTLHRVQYDTQAVIRSIKEHHFFPNPEWLIAKLAGRQPGS